MGLKMAFLAVSPAHQIPLLKDSVDGTGSESSFSLDLTGYISTIYRVFNGYLVDIQKVSFSNLTDIH